MDDNATPSTPLSTPVYVPIAIFAAFVVLIYLRVYDDNGLGAGLLLFVLLLTALYTLVSFIAMFRRNRRREMPRFLMLVASLFAGSMLLTASEPTVQEGIRLHVSYGKKFAACRQSAVPVGDIGAMSLCDSYDHHPATAHTPEHFVEIIYDATDQIALPANRRSAAWTDTIQSGVMGSFQYPFKATNIIDHFYWVTFIAPFDKK